LRHLQEFVAGRQRVVGDLSLYAYRLSCGDKSTMGARWPLLGLNYKNSSLLQKIKIAVLPLLM